MDGDLAPARELGEVCARHGALLVLDEAHAVLQPDVPLPDDVDVLRVGTLSKTLGALGGFVAGPARFTDLVVNRARAYIFTTASTPADTAAALAALAVLRSPEGDELRARLRANVDRLRPHHPSPIVPYLCGSEHHALEVAAALLDDGLLVTAIRPPTVPPGTSRLRVTMSAVHTTRAGRPARARARVALPLVTRPGTLAFVAGTATEVGKTWWTAAVARELRDAGVTVAARKPVQSSAPGDPLDADLLAAATGVDPDTVCPAHRTYADPVGTADGRRRAGTDALHRRRPRGRAGVARRCRGRPRRRGRRASLPDRRRRRQRRLRARRSDPTSSSSSATRGWGPSTRSGCRCRSSTASRWSSRSTGTETTHCTSATATISSPTRDSTS